MKGKERFRKEVEMAFWRGGKNVKRKLVFNGLFLSSQNAGRYLTSITSRGRGVVWGRWG